MNRRIPCSNSSVKIPRCGSECLKATQIPTKGVSVHCALPPLPPSPRSPLHHYCTPGTCRPHEVALRSWSGALCPPLWCRNRSRSTTASTSSAWGLGGAVALVPSRFLRAPWVLRVTKWPLPAARGLPAGRGCAGRAGSFSKGEQKRCDGG